MQLLRPRCGLGKCGPVVANTDPLWPRATRGEAPHPRVLRWSPLCWRRTCCARWRRPPAAVSPRPASFGPAASDLCPVCGAPSTGARQSHLRGRRSQAAAHAAGQTGHRPGALPCPALEGVPLGAGGLSGGGPGLRPHGRAVFQDDAAERAESSTADAEPAVQETVQVIPGSQLLWRVNARPPNSAQVSARPRPPLPPMPRQARTPKGFLPPAERRPECRPQGPRRRAGMRPAPVSARGSVSRRPQGPRVPPEVTPPAARRRGLQTRWGRSLCYVSV